MAHTGSHFNAALAGSSLPEMRRLKVQMMVSGIGCLFGIGLTVASAAAGLAAMTACVALVGFVASYGIRTFAQRRGARLIAHAAASEPFLNEIRWMELYIEELQRWLLPIFETAPKTPSATTPDHAAAEQPVRRTSRSDTSDVFTACSDERPHDECMINERLPLETLQQVACLVSVMKACESLLAHTRAPAMCEPHTP